MSLSYVFIVNVVLRWLFQLVISLYIWLFSGKSPVFVDKLDCHYLTTNSFYPTFINHVSVVQLRGPHMARHSVFSGPRKHSGEIIKSEICRKACEATFVPLNCMRWIKCVCTRTMITTFFV